MHPEDAITLLETAIVGAMLHEVRSRIEDFFKETKTQIPGMDASDFSDAILKLKPMTED